MDADQFRVAAHAAVEEIIDYNRTLEQRRIVPSVVPGYLKDKIPSAASTGPQQWHVIQPDIEKLILPGMTHWQHPGFMAYYPADTSYPAMLGELYSACFNTPGFNWMCGPVSTELEVIVMDWIAKMINLPACFLSSSGTGGGMITTTTSEATICAITASRNRVVNRFCTAEDLVYGTPEWENRAFEIQSHLVVLASDQTHSCAQKGAMITGTRFRSVPTSAEDGYTLRAEHLRSVLADCEHDGLIPFFLTLNMGTTSTCAVDPAREIVAALHDQPNVWVHVDAAYAGAALVCEEYHALTSAYEKVDSFVFNMHKWLAVTFDASCVWFRDRQSLIEGLSLTRKPPFLQYGISASPSSNNDDNSAKQQYPSPVEYNDWQLVLGRRFRALKVWFVLRSYGTRALQDHVRKGIRFAGLLYNLMKTRTDLFDIFSGPVFGLVTFSVRLPDASRATAVTAAVVNGQKNSDECAPQMHGHANGTVHSGHEDKENDELGNGTHHTPDKPKHDIEIEAIKATAAIAHQPQHQQRSHEQQAQQEESKRHKQLEASNRLTRLVLDRVNAEGRIFLTETTVDDTVLIRVSCGGQNAQEQHILTAYDVIVQAAETCQHDLATKRQ